MDSNLITPQQCATTWSPFPTKIITRKKESWSMILVLAFLLSTLLLNPGVGALEPPDILSNDPSIVIQAGLNLVVICHGDAPLHWTVPLPVDDRFSFEYSSIPSNSTNSSGSGSIPRPYASTLTLSPVSVRDVGIYECHYNSSSEGDSIYVYVDDESNPILGLDSEISILNVYSGMMLTIPCKPSTPNVTIEMKFNSVEDIPLTKENYNPHFGLLIDPVLTSSDGLYTCTGKKSRNGTMIIKSKLWLVTVTPAPINATSIILRTPKISSVDGGVVQLGGNFSIECTTVEESFVYYNINWTEPSHVINSGRAMVSLEPIKEPSSSSSTRKAFKVTLTVTNAQKQDAGNYVCSVWTMHSRKTADKYINVYGSEERFLNVSTDKTDITERGGFDATWVIHISSYPTSLDYAWKRNGEEIGRIPANPKYQIERKGPILVLKIRNASIRDGGSYQFQVRLQDFRDIVKTLDLNLTVLDKPEVFIKRKDGGEVYFHQNKTYSLTCSARGNPLPRISWWFKEMQTFEEMRTTTTKSPGGVVGLSFGSFDCGSKAGMERIEPDPTNTSPTPPGTSRTFTSTTISFRPSKHGVLFCEGDNDEGEGCSQRAVKVIDFPSENNKGFGVIAPMEYVDQDFVQLSCALSKLNSGREITWKKRGNDGILTDVKIDNSSVMLSSYETKWSWQKILTFPKIGKAQNGEYICILTPSSGSNEEIWNETITVDVKDMIPPSITLTNLNETEVTFKEGEPPELRLYCVSSGLPSPSIQWTKDGLDPSKWPDDIKYNISEDGQSLTFSYIRSGASGKYSCTATNRNGSISTFMDIEVEGTGIHPVLIGFIVICVTVIIILIFCIIKNSHKKAKMKRFLEEIQKQEFEQGAVDNINPELGIEDQANLLPYDNKKWEFPRNRLRLGMQLGSGAFGRVMKAEAIGINTEEPVTIVAVKMVKANADEGHIKALMSELKIMVHLGRHVNVVNLLGAVTTNLVKKKELFVIVEFCKYGSLLNYMHRHRHTFINQLDPIRGVIDSSVYRQLSRSSAQSSEATPRLNYASLTFTDTGNSRTASNGYRTLEEIPVSTSPTSPCGGVGGHFDHGSVIGDGRSSADYQMGSMCTDMSYISSSPNTATANGPGPGGPGGGGHRDRRSSCASSTWGGGGDRDGHYRGDYHHVDVRPIRSVDLLGWAFQMARGMEYLASRKVLHGDLAARNALLTEGNVVKICDFGLAKEMYKDYKYKKKSEGVLLPVKWMAIESIYYGVFSTQSDVWSFGVVLWELFTLGKTPYPGMEADDRFYKMLNEGYRMEKPPLAPSSIYDLMTECWGHDSTSRPTFSTLVDRIGDLMEEGHRQQYVDLNVPYDRMNREWFGSGREDYLSKMSGPDFISASARPTPDRGYENVPSTSTDECGGYLVPNPGTNLSVNLLSPLGGGSQTTQYQNIVHQNPSSSPNRSSNPDSEPSGQFLANNAGYVFMSHGGGGDGGFPSNSTANAPYVKFDIESDQLPPPSTATATNVGYVALGLGVGDRISDNQNISSDEDNARIPSPSPTSTGGGLVGGISNQNYVPNHVSQTYHPNEPPCSPSPLEQVDEEGGGSGSGRGGGKTENNSKNHQLNGSGNVRRHLNRRQKNDSGLGSIDSNNFDASARDEAEGGENFCDVEMGGVLPSQHNLSYVSHAFSNGKNDQVPPHQKLNGVIV